MKQRKTTNGLDFESLRLGIERCDLDLILGFYAEDAELSIVNAQAQRSSPFELRGRAEIAKHLRTVYGQGTSHHIEGEILGKDRVTFREACEYPDGGRLWVSTTLEVHDSRITRQADVVAKNAPLDREKEISPRQPMRAPQPWPRPGMDAPQPD